MSKKSTNVNSNIEFVNVGSPSLVVKSIAVREKPKSGNRFKCSQSENNVNAAATIKQKIVSKVRSWSSRDRYSLDEAVEVETDLAKSFKSPTDTENEEVADSNLTRAKDSLENLQPNEQWKSRSCSSTTSEPQHKDQQPGSPKSSPILNDASKPGRSLFWDPFDKRSRRNRKDFNRKKKKYCANAEPLKKESASIPLEGKTCLTKKEEKPEDPSETQEAVEDEFPYKYRYFPKNSKSVVFTNEVFVVYFNGEEVVYESKEPLKKDVEQQERNKEMRQGHLVKAKDKYNLCLY